MKRTHVIVASVALAVAAVVFALLPRAGGEHTARVMPAREGAAQLREDVRENRVEVTQENRGVAPGRVQQIVLAIERALVARDPHQRETAFAFLLPELIDVEPARAIDLVARQEPGETRDALRDEVVRIWIVKDREAAVAWIGTLANEEELKSAATIAVRTLSAIKPADAIDVADQFGIGRDDGSLEHLVQIWAAEKPAEARRWMDAQAAAGTYNASSRNGTPSKPD